MTAAQIRAALPRLAEETIRAADEALAGIQLLPGSGEKSFVGDPPRWLENPYGHPEYTFHLNRMNHFVPLLCAFALSGEGKYAEKVVREVEDWLEQCPCPATEDPAAYDGPGAGAWRSLEAGIRMHKTWCYIPQYLEGTPYFTGGFRERFYASVRRHAWVLREICPKLWPEADHNHYLMENLGLLAAANMLEDGELRAHAVRELERCALKQITNGGGQIEGCPSYHNGSVFWFTHALRLYDGFSAEYKARVRSMLDYSVYTCRPNGTTVPWGDSTAKHGAARSAALGYLAFGDAEHLKQLRQFMDRDILRRACENLAWELEDVDALLRELEEPPEKPLPAVRGFEGLDQAALRTGWGRDALSVFFACRTPVQNAHAHIDPMGFDFTAFGKPMVVDPGKFSYKEGEERYRFKSAAWHNTVTVDGKDHFAYLSSWRYGPQGEGHITALDGNTVEAVHHCYAPVVHRRRLTLLPDMLVVEDTLENCAEETAVDLYFHLDYDIVHLDEKAGIARTQGPGPSVRLEFDAGLEAEVLEGLVSDVNDTARQSRRLRLHSAGGAGTRTFCTRIVPVKEGGSGR